MLKKDAKSQIWYKRGIETKTFHMSMLSFMNSKPLYVNNTRKNLLSCLFYIKTNTSIAKFEV